MNVALEHIGSAHIKLWSGRWPEVVLRPRRHISCIHDGESGPPLIRGSIERGKGLYWTFTHLPQLFSSGTDLTSVTAVKAEGYVILDEPSVDVVPLGLILYADRWYGYQSRSIYCSVFYSRRWSRRKLSWRPTGRASSVHLQRCGRAQATLLVISPSVWRTL